MTVRQPLDTDTIRIFHQRNLLAEHELATGKGEMVMKRAHYSGLPRRTRVSTATPATMIAELTPGPGVGLHHAVPVVELRPLSVYEEVAHVAAV